MAIIQETNTGQFMITIPKHLMKATGWKKGTELITNLDDTGNIILKEMKPKKREKK